MILFLFLEVLLVAKTSTKKKFHRICTEVRRDKILKRLSLRRFPKIPRGRTRDQERAWLDVAKMISDIVERHEGSWPLLPVSLPFAQPQREQVLIKYSVVRSSQKLVSLNPAGCAVEAHAVCDHPYRGLLQRSAGATNTRDATSSAD